MRCLGRALARSDDDQYPRRYGEEERRRQSPPQTSSGRIRVLRWFLRTRRVTKKRHLVFEPSPIWILDFLQISDFEHSLPAQPEILPPLLFFVFLRVLRG
jgi:hypothetical protein